MCGLKWRHWPKQEEGGSRRMREIKISTAASSSAFPLTTRFLRDLKASLFRLLPISPTLKDAGDGGWARGAYAKAKPGSERGRRAPRQTPSGARAQASVGDRGGVARGAKDRGGSERGGNGVGCGPRLTPKRRGGRSPTANPGAPRKEAGLEPQGISKRSRNRPRARPWAPWRWGHGSREVCGPEPRGTHPPSARALRT